MEMEFHEAKDYFDCTKALIATDGVLLSDALDIAQKLKIVILVFSGNKKDNKIKLVFARIKIRDILFTNDTVNGVHFQFSDSSQYWTFVKSIDILRAEGAKTYMPLGKDLWFYHFPREQ